MSIQDIRDGFDGLESDVPKELLEKYVADAFDSLVDYLNLDADSGERMICENIATHYIDNLEHRGAILIAGGVSNDAFKMMDWMRLVEAVLDSEYKIPDSLKAMYETISELSLAALFRRCS